MHIGLSLALTRLSRTGGGAPPSPFDPDALAYITAVEAADTQALEPGVRVAIDDFVRGCKADGIWAAIKASCILAGARTLAGALVPLVGPAPTNFNFVGADYNRRTGLLGNGTTKYLNTNRNANADPQNSQHLSVFVHTGQSGSTAGSYLDSGAANGDSLVTKSAVVGRIVFRSRYSGGPSLVVDGVGNPTGFSGVTRSSSTAVVARTAQQDFSFSNSSATPTSNPATVFARFGSPVSEFTDGRIQFYSIGEHLNLAQLESRLSTLMTALEFGINTGLPASDYDADTVDYINRGYAAGGSLS
jgi:hypothetical protein